jgi:hypothetical protein
MGLTHFPPSRTRAIAGTGPSPQLANGSKENVVFAEYQHIRSWLDIVKGQQSTDEVALTKVYGRWEVS